LLARSVLDHHHFGCAQDQRAFGGIYTSGEGGRFTGLVVFERIGLNEHGFAAVRFFGGDPCGRQQGGQGEEDRCR